MCIFIRNDHLKERRGRTLFKLAIVGYAIGSSVAAFYAVTNVLANSKAPYDHLSFYVGGTLLLIILLFASEYLLIYRYFPSSFEGDIGDNFWTQLFSFLYFSSTAMPGTCLGDIVSDNLTVRVLIKTEMAFFLLTIAKAVCLDKLTVDNKSIDQAMKE